MTDRNVPSSITATEPQAAIATAPVERFRLSAAAATRHSGLSASQHDALIREMVDHLTETWEAARARGLSIDEATGYALRVFGQPETVRRGLTRERLMADLHAALALPLPIVALVLSDSLAGAILRGRQFLVSRTDGFIFLTGATVLSATVLAISLVSVRFGWRQCRLGLQRSVTPMESFAGGGFVAAGVGFLLLLGPGAIAPALCDLLDILAGRNLPLSLVALSGGLTAGVLGMLAGALFRHLGAHTPVEG